MIVRRARSARTRFQSLVTEESKYRVVSEVLYNTVVRCRDWMRIMGASIEKISELDGIISRARKSL